MSAQGRERPNLLFVFADQMRAQDCGFMGSGEVRTPHLDRIAREGVTFTNAVSTCPVCTPYRASLLTGRYPLSLGMVQNDVRLSTEVTSIAHVLRDEGYRTGYVGKWHLDGQYRGGFTPPGPRRQGFDYWRVANCNHDYLRGYYYADDPEPVFMEGYDADWQTDQAMQFIRETAGDAFCLFLSWGPPHNPCWVMPEEYKLYAPGDVTLRPNVPVELADEARGEIAGYWSHITALDRNMGRLMDCLEETGVADDTIVVFTSDHGDMLGSQGMARKQKPFEESLMVPFVLRWPGRAPAGLRCDTLINAPDVMPTLLSLMGAPVPDTVEGADLSHAALGEPGDEPTSAFIGNPCPFHGDAEGLPEWRGVRTKTHTYVRGLDGPMMLYDNAADPYQL
ncbi:MAG: sulfatase, partial [Armatimonadetes bacterium]|nr:sulfatase [Armatimonadota bacterium]